MGQFSVADLPKNLEDQHSHQVCIQIIRSLNILNMIFKKKVFSPCLYSQLLSTTKFATVSSNDC